MPIIKSAKKRVRTARKATIRNVKTKRTVRASIKQFQLTLTSKKTAAPKALAEAQSAIDTAEKKNVLSKNKAARMKQRLAAQAKAAGVSPAAAAKAKKSPSTPKKTTKAAAKPATKKAAAKKPTANPSKKPATSRAKKS